MRRGVLFRALVAMAVAGACRCGQAVAQEVTPEASGQEAGQWAWPRHVVSISGGYGTTSASFSRPDGSFYRNRSGGEWRVDYDYMLWGRKLGVGVVYDGVRNGFPDFHVSHHYAGVSLVGQAVVRERWIYRLSVGAGYLSSGDGERQRGRMAVDAYWRTEYRLARRVGVGLGVSALFSDDKHLYDVYSFKPGYDASEGFELFLRLSVLGGLHFYF